MLSIKKYAAIDIGSNAVRLLISNIIEEKGKPARFKKSSLVRVPIRLGSDVFLNKKISKENIVRMIDTMQAFKLLMKSHTVEQYTACATSAMREATNGYTREGLIAEATIFTLILWRGTRSAIIANRLHAL